MKQGGFKPYKGQSGEKSATELMDTMFGKGNYEKGPGSDHNKIKKYFETHFE